MAENDAGRQERLIACLNILRRVPTEGAEEVRLQNANCDIDDLGAKLQIAVLRGDSHGVRVGRDLCF